MGRPITRPSRVIAKPINTWLEPMMGFATNAAPGPRLLALPILRNYSWRMRARKESHENDVVRCTVKFVAGRERTNAGRRRRYDARARAQRRQGAAELVAAPRQLRGPPFFVLERDQHRQHWKSEACVHLGARRHRSRRQGLQARHARSDSHR